MNFKDLYQTGKPRFSFEIFPPKMAKGIPLLIEALKDLKPFNPAVISVTYGAMGTTQDRTRDLSIQIHKELGIPTAFHFTCVGGNRDSIRSYIEPLKREGLNLIVALRGDVPAGSEKFTKPKDGFGYANELVEYLHEIGGFSIAVAGYPEGHVECKSKEIDLRNLKRKVDAGADIVITQLFFENSAFFDFEKRARAIGITQPIIPGIMPIVNLAQIEKITKMCGASLPGELREKLATHRSDPEKIKAIGIEHAITQCKELLAHGASGIHFYTLNKSSSVKRVIEGLS